MISSLWICITWHLREGGWSESCCPRAERTVDHASQLWLWGWEHNITYVWFSRKITRISSLARPWKSQTCNTQVQKEKKTAEEGWRIPAWRILIKSGDNEKDGAFWHPHIPVNNTFSTLRKGEQMPYQYLQSISKVCTIMCENFISIGQLWRAWQG